MKATDQRDSVTVRNNEGRKKLTAIRRFQSEAHRKYDHRPDQGGRDKSHAWSSEEPTVLITCQEDGQKIQYTT
ncbi:MAG: hypothetical protein CME32_25755 [Gimesia sp.]|nr:hypothetical protein [Gimesia sp.]